MIIFSKFDWGWKILKTSRDFWQGCISPRHWGALFNECWITQKIPYESWELRVEFFEQFTPPLFLFRPFAGLKNGYEVMFDMHNSDAVRLLPYTGMDVVLHHPSEPPSVSGTGFVVTTGVQTFVEIGKTSVSKASIEFYLKFLTLIPTVSGLNPPGWGLDSNTTIWSAHTSYA